MSAFASAAVFQTHLTSCTRVSKTFCNRTPILHGLNLRCCVVNTNNYTPHKHILLPCVRLSAMAICYRHIRRSRNDNDQHRRETILFERNQNKTNGPLNTLVLHNMPASCHHPNAHTPSIHFRCRPRVHPSMQIKQTNTTSRQNIVHIGRLLSLPPFVSHPSKWRSCLLWIVWIVGGSGEFWKCVWGGVCLWLWLRRGGVDSPVVSLERETTFCVGWCVDVGEDEAAAHLYGLLCVLSF